MTNNKPAGAHARPIGTTEKWLVIVDAPARPGTPAHTSQSAAITGTLEEALARVARDMRRWQTGPFDIAGDTITVTGPYYVDSYGRIVEVA